MDIEFLCYSFIILIVCLRSVVMTPLSFLILIISVLTFLLVNLTQFRSVTQSWSNSLRPHEPQHARPTCPFPTPKVHSNPCPSSRWCHDLILCRPLLLLPSIFPSIRFFSNESALCIRWPKYWSFSFSISSSSEYSGLISFRMDWLDLLAVQGILKSLLQHHSSKASILRCSLSSQSNSHIHTWPLEKP